MSPLCDVCSSESWKYKCPACGCRSCSSQCIQKHKQINDCSGQRNKAAYVPPNAYGYGALMDDYAYLEQIGRTLELAQKGPAHGRRPRKAELEWVRRAREQGVQFLLVPDGMERRKSNQTKWNDRASALHLTLTFQFHIAHQTFTLTTHANPGTTSLFDLLHKPMQDGRVAKILPKEHHQTIKDALANLALRYLLPLSADPRTADYEVPEKKLPPAHPSLPAKPVFAPLHEPPSSVVKRPAAQAEDDRPLKKPRPAPQYLQLDPQEMLFSQLKGSTIIEWPIIEVWLADELDQQVQAQHLVVTSRPTPPVVGAAPVIAGPASTAPAPTTALASLAGYGSDSGQEEDQVAKSLLVA